MPSIHINAPAGAIASSVLMPGDPLRAKYIAETFFDNPCQVTDVRSMLGFSGTYHGHQISVMAHGMGIPSASIYCTELIREYGVRRVVRVGSCGTVQPGIKLMDIIIALAASTDSNVNRMRFGGHDLAAVADFALLRAAVRTAEARDMAVHVGNVFSTDLFYGHQPEFLDLMARHRILGVEMETAGIYALAAELGVEALAMCTVSDHITKGQKLSTEDRQTSFDQMIELALETVVSRLAESER